MEEQTDGKGAAADAFPVASERAFGGLFLLLLDVFNVGVFLSVHGMRMG